MSSTITFTLPDILANFPYSRRLSEYYEEAKAESSLWTESYHFFSDQGLRGFDRCDFNLLASLAYSSREREIIRLGCDLMNLFYVFDEYTDITNAQGAEEIRKIVMSALRNPHQRRPKQEFSIGEMTRDLIIRATCYVSSNAPCITHFIDEWDAYTAAVVKEAEDRTNKIHRTFKDYLDIRRKSSGCLPSFVLCEFGLDLPEDVYWDPLMDKLREQATDLIAIGNDICSYPMEKSRGLELHNSVELVMKEEKLDIQGAINWLERYAADVHDAFLSNVRIVLSQPSRGKKVDEGIRTYIDGLAQWVRGNDDWTFESGRYFGDKGLEVQKTRVTSLLPPSKGYVSEPLQM